jgi:vitamin B12 transporter
LGLVALAALVCSAWARVVGAEPVRVAEAGSAQVATADDSGASGVEVATANDVGARIANVVAAGDAGASEPLSVVVEGKARHPAEPSRDAGVAGSVIGRRELRKPAVELSDALRGEPGMQVTDLGGVGAPATASIRGATANQTPVYFGGIRLNDEVGGVADLGRVPVFFLERVEVYRSQAPIDGDAIGIGGAIYLEPRRAANNEAVVGTMFGSYGTRELWGYTAQRSEHGGALVAVRVDHADNDYKYRDGKGTSFVAGDDGNSVLPNADVGTKDLWLMLDRDLGAGKLSVLANLTDREQGAVKLAALPSKKARVAYQRGLLGVTASIEASRRVRLELVTEGISTHQDIDDPLGELALHVPRVRIEGRRVGQRASMRLRLPGENVLSLSGGTAIDRLERYEIEGATSFDDPLLSAQRFSNYLRSGLDFALFEHAHLRGMASVECRTTTLGAISNACSDLSLPWRLGTLIEFGRHAVYGSVGQVQRVPTLGELYGVSLVVLGNPELKPERALSAEVGWRYTGRRDGARRPLWLDGSVFSRFVEHVVTYVHAAEGHLVPINHDRGRIMGAELTGGIGVASGLEMRGTVTLLDPRDRTPYSTYGNDILPYHSRMTALGALDARLPWEADDLGPIDLELRVTHESSRYADPAGTEVIPAQTSVDFGIRAEALQHRLTTHLRVANVLDAQRFDVVGYPLPRRSAFLSMEAKW